MTEHEKLNAKSEVYLSLRRLSHETKRIYRQAFLDFFALLLERGRNTPIEDDYDDFRYYLRFDLKKEISTAEYAISCVKRFFAWSAENPECTSLDTVKTFPQQAPCKKRSRKVSTMLSAYLYEAIELLADYDGIDIPTMLNALVSKYVAHRKNDIDRVKGMAIAEVQYGA